MRYCTRRAVLRTSQEWRIVLSDFGISRRLTTKLMTRDVVTIWCPCRCTRHYVGTKAPCPSACLRDAHSFVREIVHCMFRSCMPFCRNLLDARSGFSLLDILVFAWGLSGTGRPSCWILRTRTRRIASTRMRSTHGVGAACCMRC